MRVRALLGRKSGEIEIDSDSVRFFADGASTPSTKLALSELDISLAGENNAIFLLTRAGSSEPQISVTDREVVQLLANYGHPQAGVILTRASRKRGLRRTAIGAFVGGILAFLVGVPLVVMALPTDWLDSVISPKIERKLGEAMASGYISRSADPKPFEERVERIVTFLKKSNPELAAIDVSVRMNLSRVPNAFAFPGGVLGINTGLVKEAGSIEEVIGVIGHELGHVEARHAFKGFIESLGFAAGVGLLAVFISPELATGVMHGGNLGLLANSRKAEREADRLAMGYLSNAGVSVQGMIDFFTRMQKYEIPGAAGKVASIVSTHPMSSDRTDALKARLNSRPVEREIQLPVTLTELRDHAD